MSGFECNKCRRGTGGCQTALGCVLGTWKAGIYTALCVFQVDKETNTESLAQSSTVVRPKDKRAANPPQTQFVRGSTIIRSKTFSPGPQSQYVCRVRKMKPWACKCLFSLSLNFSQKPNSAFFSPPLTSEVALSSPPGQYLPLELTVFSTNLSDLYVHVYLWHMQLVEMPKLTWQGCSKTVMNTLHIKQLPAAWSVLC